MLQSSLSLERVEEESVKDCKTDAEFLAKMLESSEN
jgi:hypothetical protein